MPDFAQILKQTLPRRVIRLRERHSLTQRGMAEAAGIAASTLNEIESGLATDVMLSTLVLIATRFQATPDFLLGFDQKELNFARFEGGLGPEIAHLAEEGWSESALAARFGVSVGSVGRILADEWEARRLRRGRV